MANIDEKSKRPEADEGERLCSDELECMAWRLALYAWSSERHKYSKYGIESYKLCKPFDTWYIIKGTYLLNSDITALMVAWYHFWTDAAMQGKKTPPIKICCCLANNPLSSKATLSRGRLSDSLIGSFYTYHLYTYCGLTKTVIESGLLHTYNVERVYASI